MIELAYKVLGFLLTLGVLVIIHELGHYLVARWCGVKVVRFSVGFGRVERYDRGQHRPDEVSSRSCTEAGDHRSHRHAEDDHEDEREHAVARR